MVQFSHPYMATGKIITLTKGLSVNKVISLLFNMLSRFVRAVLPRSKLLLILWLLPPSTVILEPKKKKIVFQFSPVTQSCPTLCNPMNHSMPGLPVHHQLLELTQTHVHRVGDVIQPSHTLSSPSPPAPNPTLHHGLFK